MDIMQFPAPPAALIAVGLGRLLIGLGLGSHRKTVLMLLGTLLISGTLLFGADDDRFVQRLKLPSKQTVVIAEGDFEPRSIGSYSIRLYSGTDPAFPSDDFITGLVHERDGTIEQVLLADIDGDGKAEVVIVIRSAGSAGDLSAHAYAIDKRTLVLRATVAEVPRDADPVAALKKPGKNLL